MTGVGRCGGDYGDIDVTAMTIQALAPQYDSSGAVSEAVDRAVDFLSERQKEDGGYESFGNPNAESTAQVLMAVSALGIDCRYDDRFIKEGNDLIDGIAQYRLPDGSFCHTKDEGFNETATVQAYYSFVAFRRMTEGKSPLLVLDNKQTAQPSQGGSNEGGGSSKVSSQGGGSSANEGGKRRHNGSHNGNNLHHSKCRQVHGYDLHGHRDYHCKAD